MAETKDHPILFTLFGLNRAGRILYTSLFVLAVPALMVWTILIPRLRFHEQDEHLFKAARHGDVAGIARALAEGANVNAEAPIDGKTALFRAAAFGYADAVRALLKAGADPERRAAGHTVLEFAEDVRKQERDPARAQTYDQVIAVLREVQR
jgi:Ankyrin repeats (3 copies)